MNWITINNIGTIIDSIYNKIIQQKDLNNYFSVSFAINYNEDKIIQNYIKYYGMSYIKSFSDNNVVNLSLNSMQNVKNIKSFYEHYDYDITEHIIMCINNTKLKTVTIFPHFLKREFTNTIIQTLLICANCDDFNNLCFSNKITKEIYCYNKNALIENNKNIFTKKYLIKRYKNIPKEIFCIIFSFMDINYY